MSKRLQLLIIHNFQFFFKTFIYFKLNGRVKEGREKKQISSNLRFSIKMAPTARAGSHHTQESERSVSHMAVAQ